MSLSRSVCSLLVAGLLCKFIGLFYRVPLSYLLGAEGIGLYQMAYPVFAVAAIVAAGGLPLAMAKHMAEHLAVGKNEAAWHLFQVGRLLLWAQGLMLGTIFYHLAPILATRVLGDPRSELALKALAPAVFLLCIEGSLRGYFQGRQQHVVLAKAQAFEQLCRVGTMLILAFLLLPYGLEYAAAGATAGAAGGALGAIILLQANFRPGLGADSQPRLGNWYKSAQLLQHFAVPVMLGSFVMPVMQMVDAAIVPLRLQAGGVSVREATALFGQHAGMALSLVGLPTVATAALATTLVPDLAAASARGDKAMVAGRVSQALKLTVTLATPAAVGLFALAEEICQVLFGTPEAAIPLRWLAFGTVGLCLMETNSALLHALDQGRWAALAIFVGGIVNAGIDYYVCALPAFNIRGAALGTGLGFTVAALLTLGSLRKCVPGFWDPGIILFPLLASVLMVPAVRWALVFGLGQGWPLAGALFWAVGIGIVCYGFLAYSVGLFEASVFRLPPDKFL